MFGTTAEASTSLAAGHVEVLLGNGATVPTVTAPSASSGPASATPSSILPTTGAQGGAVSGGTGIPCVN
jgi:hypothetical protein